MAFTVPTNNETIEVQSIGQSGPAVEGSIIYRVQWTCSSTPAPTQVAWSIDWNGMTSATGTVDVVWTGTTGAAIGAPTFTPYYSGINSGTNTYKLAATDQVNNRDASVDCTIVAM